MRIETLLRTFHKEHTLGLEESEKRVWSRVLHTFLHFPCRLPAIKSERLGEVLQLYAAIHKFASCHSHYKYERSVPEEMKEEERRYSKWLVRIGDISGFQREDRVVSYLEFFVLNYYWRGIGTRFDAVTVEQIERGLDSVFPKIQDDYASIVSDEVDAVFQHSPLQHPQERLEHLALLQRMLDVPLGSMPQSREIEVVHKLEQCVTEECVVNAWVEPILQARIKSYEAFLRDPSHRPDTMDGPVIDERNPDLGLLATRRRYDDLQLAANYMNRFVYDDQTIGVSELDHLYLLANSISLDEFSAYANTNDAPYLLMSFLKWAEEPWDANRTLGVHLDLQAMCDYALIPRDEPIEPVIAYAMTHVLFAYAVACVQWFALKESDGEIASKNQHDEASGPYASVGNEILMLSMTLERFQECDLSFLRRLSARYSVAGRKLNVGLALHAYDWYLANGYEDDLAGDEEWLEGVDTLNTIGVQERSSINTILLRMAEKLKELCGSDFVLRHLQRYGLVVGDQVSNNLYGIQTVSSYGDDKTIAAKEGSLLNKFECEYARISSLSDWRDFFEPYVGHEAQNFLKEIERNKNRLVDAREQFVPLPKHVKKTLTTDMKRIYHGSTRKLGQYDWYLICRRVVFAMSRVAVDGPTLAPMIGFAEFTPEMAVRPNTSAMRTFLTQIGLGGFFEDALVRGLERDGGRMKQEEGVWIEKLPPP